MREFGRRKLFRLGLAVAVGGVTGNALFHTSIELNKAVSEATGYQAGNAYLISRRKVACQESVDQVKCVQDFQSSIDKVTGVVLAPISEELIYRVSPSAGLDLYNKDGPELILKNLIQGRGGIGLTRRELILGLATSLIFGLRHNSSKEGIDTQTIPSSQTLGAFTYMYLQRKLGVFANITSHAVLNFRALTA